MGNWYKTSQVYGYMATAHFADFWVRVMTKTWAERAAQNIHGAESALFWFPGRKSWWFQGVKEDVAMEGDSLVVRRVH